MHAFIVQLKMGLLHSVNYYVTITIVYLLSAVVYLEQFKSVLAYDINNEPNRFHYIYVFIENSIIILQFCLLFIYMLFNFNEIVLGCLAISSFLLTYVEFSEIEGVE